MNRYFSKLSTILLGFPPLLNYIEDTKSVEFASVAFVLPFFINREHVSIIVIFLFLRWKVLLSTV